MFHILANPNSQPRTARTILRDGATAAASPGLLAASLFALLLVLLAPSLTAPAHAQERELLNRLVQASGGTDAALLAFSEGRDLIADEKWSKAAERFGRFINQYPQDKNVDAAYYWLAFAFKKQNKFYEAKSALDKLMVTYPSSSWANDAKKMLVELSPNIDPKIADNFKDDTDVELKIIALQSLCQAEQQRCPALINDVLRGGAQSPLRLREAAISLLGRYGGPEAVPVLINLVRSEPDEKLRMRAIASLGKSGDERALEILKQQAMSTDFKDESPADSAIHALAGHDSPRAVNVLGEVAMAARSFEARTHAVHFLSQRKGEPVVDELLRLYDSDPNVEFRKHVITAFGNRISPRAGAKLVEIARSNAPLELRKQAINAIPHRNQPQDLDSLLSLYDTTREEELKDNLLDSIGRYKDRRVLLKLMEVVRSNAPVERRKKAITWLSRSKDPEVLRFLEDMLR